MRAALEISMFSVVWTLSRWLASIKLYTSENILEKNRLVKCLQMSGISHSIAQFSPQLLERACGCGQGKQI